MNGNGNGTKARHAQHGTTPIKHKKMKAVTSTWFECAVKYERTTEEGPGKKVTESYVVEAFSFTEAEAKILDEMGHHTSGELEIKKITPLNVTELFFSEKDADDSWFKCKLAFITTDEKTGREKRSAASYLVQADSLGTALKYVVQEMGRTSIDYVASTISETKVMDVFR